MTDDLVLLPAGTIACAPGGRTVSAPPEDSPALEAIEAFHDFIRIAPPPVRRDESGDDYRARVGVERWTGWRFMLLNDPGLRQYIEGGAWT